MNATTSAEHGQDSVIHAMSISPTGIVSIIALTMPARLELVRVKNTLAVGIRYISGGSPATAIMVLCALDTGINEEDIAGALDRIAGIGMQKSNQDESKDRLLEAAKPLMNIQGVNTTRYNDIVASIEQLVICYWKARAVFTGKVKAVEPEQRLGWEWEMHRG